MNVYEYINRGLIKLHDTLLLLLGGRDGYLNCLSRMFASIQNHLVSMRYHHILDTKCELCLHSVDTAIFDDTMDIV